MEFESKIFSKSIFDTLYETGKTLSTAESCTSGRLAEALTAVPGASDFFIGGIVSYSNNLKINMLGVDPAVIAEKTAVCEEVVIQMVKGACKAMGTDYAVASTGFAGPGAEGDIPVGTIWVACGTADEVRTLKLEGDHGRDKNILAATQSALKLLDEYLLEIFPQADLSEVPAVEAK